MRVISQIIVIGLMTAVAVPLGARSVPGTRPWLDQIGLLQPLAALGVVPDAAEGTAGPTGQSAEQGAGVGVVAQELRQSPLQTVISAIGSARGVQAVDLSFEVTGRLKALAVAPGDMVRAGDVVAELDAEAAELRWQIARGWCWRTPGHQCGAAGTTGPVGHHDGAAAARG
jgi:hypothetical protein